MMTRPSRRLGFSFALVAALLLPGSAPAEHHEAAEHHEGEAAERALMVGEKITRHGKVVSIDAETRTVVVEGEQGRQVSITAPEDARGGPRGRPGWQSLAKRVLAGPLRSYK